MQSLCHPGGNATGLSTIAPELTGKRLELLKEVLPELAQVALLINPDAQISQLYLDEARLAAESLGLAARIYSKSGENVGRASLVRWEWANLERALISI